MRYIDPNSFAENPGGICLSDKKFEQVKKLLGSDFISSVYVKPHKKRINEYLKMGDTQPALVCSASPLIIAAYSDEMDAVIMLTFPDELAKQYDLSEGTRLVTSNVYSYIGLSGIAKDIFIGEDYLNRYSDFIPVVSLFLSDDELYLKNRTEIFSEEIWQRVTEKAQKYSAEHPTLKRNGFFYLLKNRR